MTLARELTDSGLTLARELLDDARKDPQTYLSVPEKLLCEDTWSRPLDVEIELEARQFRSRQDAADYLIPRLGEHRIDLIERDPFWSWLGMFYLSDNVGKRGGRVRILKRDESYVMFSDDDFTSRRRYLHYLWSACQLSLQHPDATYLLGRRVLDQGDIADRVFSYQRIFNSAGVVELIERLYTDGTSTKRQFGRSQGGLRHLIRVLDQLERTYDVYGMDVDSLLDILPPAFDRWKP